MMPLTLADTNELNIIKRITGKPEVRQHLQDMGFVVGGEVSIISKIGDNVIVNVKNVRIAISSELAQRIMV